MPFSFPEIRIRFFDLPGLEQRRNYDKGQRGSDDEQPRPHQRRSISRHLGDIDKGKQRGKPGGEDGIR